jgi:hypothetical protein
MLAALSHSLPSRPLRGTRALGEWEYGRPVPGWSEVLILRRLGQGLVSTAVGGGSNWPRRGRFSYVGARTGG